MKYILFILLSLYSLNMIAQEELQVFYYNDKDVEVKKKQAVYKRVINTSEKGFGFTETWMDGTLKRVGFASQYEPRLRQIGKEITYYRNGKVKQEHVVKGINSIGEIKRYYENGNLKERGRFLKPTSVVWPDAFDYPNYVAFQIADSLGKTFLDEGKSGKFDIRYANGDKWEGEYVNGLKEGTIKEYVHLSKDTYIEEYIKGVFQNGIYIDESGKSTAYIVKEVLPGFKGGSEQLFSYISNNLKYPSQMKKNNIQGSVMVSFTIDYDGDLKDFKIVRGIDGGEEAENETIRVLMSSPLWNPGIRRGKPVKVSYTMPVRFSLN